MEGALVDVDRAIVWKDSLLLTSSRYSCRCQVLVGRDLHEVIYDAIHHYCIVLLAPCRAYVMSKNRLRTPKLHIKDVPLLSKSFLVQPKMNIERSCLQKKPHLPDYGLPD